MFSFDKTRKSSSCKHDRELFVYKMQKERYKVFKTQDLANDGFDVTFELEGKKLHANKYILTSVSEPLNAMLSLRWSSKDEVIKVESYSYKNFYEFLCFIYSGSCTINKNNAYQLTDMAEFYGVSAFKGFCDKFLSTMDCNTKNVEQMYELADKYSLPHLLSSTRKFICYHQREVYNAKTNRAFKKPFNKFLSTFRDTKVEVRNNNLRIYGKFKDVYGIRHAMERQFCSINRRSTTQIRFLKLKFPVPSIPSAVTKMKGIDWYLCLDKEGVVTFKHSSAVLQKDYLIAKMRPKKEFHLTPGCDTYFYASYNY